MNGGGYMPSYLLGDLQRLETELYLAPSWSIDVAGRRMHLFHESAGAVTFDRGDPITKIIGRIAEGDATVADAMALAQANWLGVLVRLWQNGILRIHDGCAQSSVRQSRYVWFEEYLRTYAGPSRTIEQMFRALATAKVCVIGLGGLGATLSLSLAASGIGMLRLIDGDVVEESNLPRQILYSEASIGGKKVSALKEMILANNSATRVEAIDQFVTSQHDAEAAISGCDFVILCADQPRFVIRNYVGNACFGQGVPSLTMAGQWVGPVSVPGKSPCHACVGRFHGSRLSDAAGFIACTARVPSIRASFAPRPLILAGFMASTVIHFLTGIDTETPLDRRFQVDLAGYIKEDRLVRYRNCLVCGENTQMRAET